MYYNVKKSIESIKFILFSVSLIILAYFVFTYCDDNDYRVYFQDYYRMIMDKDAILTRDYEFGFLFLMRLATTFKIPFTFFYSFIMLFCYSLLFIFFYDNTYNAKTIFFLSLVFPFFLYLQQLRSFIAFSIVIFGLNHLINSSKNKKQILFFLCSCIIATFFQKTSIVYLCFIFSLYISKRKLKKILLFLELFAPVFLRFLYIPFLSFAKKIFKNNWMFDLYFPNKFLVQKYTYFIICIFFILLLVLMFLDSNKSTTEYRSEVLFNCSLIVCGLSLLCYFSVFLDRIAVMAIPIVYVSIYERTSTKVSLNNKVCRLSCFIFALVYLIFTIGPWNKQMHNRFFNEMWKTRPKIEDVRMIDKW